MSKSLNYWSDVFCSSIDEEVWGCVDNLTCLSNPIKLKIDLIDFWGRVKNLSKYFCNVSDDEYIIDRTKNKFREKLETYCH